MYKVWKCLNERVKIMNAHGITRSQGPVVQWLYLSLLSLSRMAIALQNCIYVYIVSWLLSFARNQPCYSIHSNAQQVRVRMYISCVDVIEYTDNPGNSVITMKTYAIILLASRSVEQRVIFAQIETPRSYISRMRAVCAPAGMRLVTSDYLTNKRWKMSIFCLWVGTNL